MESIINRVSRSPLYTLDIEELIHQGDIILFDLKPWLFRGMVIKEKEFRESLKNHNWSTYVNKNVGLVCTADAIIPVWAYMLITTQLIKHANLVTYGDEKEVEKKLIDDAIENCKTPIDFKNKKVVIKGCGKIKNKEYAYTQITAKLLPFASSIMYGEACSTVPIYKKKV